MATKLSLALGVVLGTVLPAVFGYDPAAETTAPDVQARLMAIYGGVPALLMGVGAFSLRGFPVTRERHAAVRAELSRRAGA
jgi:Na+/melibiose symporter-like transporter